MLKRKIDTYLTNYYATNRNALLITGARQIGKTYSIREFGRTFKSFIEINFLENPDAVALFKGAKNSSDILLRLSAIATKPLIKGETLIFFDEVQKCPDIVTAIKFLVDEGSYRYINLSVVWELISRSSTLSALHGKAGLRWMNSSIPKLWNCFGYT